MDHRAAARHGRPGDHHRVGAGRHHERPPRIACSSRAAPPSRLPPRRRRLGLLHEPRRATPALPTAAHVPVRATDAAGNTAPRRRAPGRSSRRPRDDDHDGPPRARSPPLRHPLFGADEPAPRSNAASTPPPSRPARARSTLTDLADGEPHLRGRRHRHRGQHRRHPRDGHLDGRHDRAASRSTSGPEPDGRHVREHRLRRRDTRDPHLHARRRRPSRRARAPSGPGLALGATPSRSPRPTPRATPAAPPRAWTVVDAAAPRRPSKRPRRPHQQRRGHRLQPTRRLHLRVRARRCRLRGLHEPGRAHRPRRRRRTPSRSAPPTRRATPTPRPAAPGRSTRPRPRRRSRARRRARPRRPRGLHLLGGRRWRDVRMPPRRRRLRTLRLARRSPLADGEHTFAVRATDAAGNTDPTPATRHLDGRHGRAGDDDHGGAASCDHADLRGLHLLGAATPARPSNARSTTAPSRPARARRASPASPTAEHTFRVRATDAAGNTGAAATRSLDGRHGRPRDDDRRRPGGPDEPRDATFAFSARAGATFECKLGDGALRTCTSPSSSPASPTASTRSASAPPTPRATPVPPPSRTWTVDTIAPETTIDSGPAGLRQTSRARRSRSAPRAGATFECKLGAGDDFDPCTSPRTTRPGRRRAHVPRPRHRRRRQHGHRRARTWTVDTAAPDTTIDSGPAGTVRRVNATFAFSRSRRHLRVQARRRGDFEPCTSPDEYTDLADGEHTFRVRATDAAGNTGHRRAAPGRSTRPGPRRTSSRPRRSGPGHRRDVRVRRRPGRHLRVQARPRRRRGPVRPVQEPADVTGLAEGEHTFKRPRHRRGGQHRPGRRTDVAGRHDAAHDDDRPDARQAHPGPARRVHLRRERAGRPLRVQARRRRAHPVRRVHEPARLHRPRRRQLRLPRPRGRPGRQHRRARRRTSGASTTRRRRRRSPMAPTPAPAPAAPRSASTPTSPRAFECRRDEQEAARRARPRTSTTDLGVGAHIFRVRAIDRAGNQGEADTHDWTIVDTTPPTTTIGEKPDKHTQDRRARVHVRRERAGRALRVPARWRRAHPLRDVREPARLHRPRRRQYIFSVRAVDRAGNPASPTTTSGPSTPRPPITTIGQRPDKTTTARRAEFGFDAERARRALRVPPRRAGDWHACVSPKDYTDLGWAATPSASARSTAPATSATPDVYDWTIVAPPPTCAATTVTVEANADSWLLQSSRDKNHGNDGDAKVTTKANDNARAVFRFPLPAIPAGCVVTDAKLRLWANSWKTGRTLEANRLASGLEGERDHLAQPAGHGRATPPAPPRARTGWPGRSPARPEPLQRRQPRLPRPRQGRGQRRCRAGLQHP